MPDLRVVPSAEAAQPDLIDLWLDITAANQSPLQYRLWSGISLVAAALERRVWTKTGKYQTFPNLYVMLVGAPGVGKQIVDEARNVWTAVRRPGTKEPAFYTASDSVTRRRMLDELAAARQTYPSTYHALMLFAEEFQILLPYYDRDFVSRLNRLYNAPVIHSETRRWGNNVRAIRIAAPILNMLAGAQPSYLSDTFPENAWETGLCRRMVMVYAAEGPIRSIFTETPQAEEAVDSLVRRLGDLSRVHGLVRWSDPAADLLREFDDDWQARVRGDKSGPERWPVPYHSRLVHYRRSRTMMLIKLAIVAAMAAHEAMVIEVEDLERALGWLLAAEELMPDIFLEMQGRSDREVIEEMHRYAMAIWARDKGKTPIPTYLLQHFLRSRAPSERAERLLRKAEADGLIARVADDGWTPRPMIGRVE